jgi:hypothetical protein
MSTRNRPSIAGFMPFLERIVRGDIDPVSSSATAGLCPGRSEPTGCSTTRWTTTRSSCSIQGHKPTELAKIPAAVVDRRCRPRGRLPSDGCPSSSDKLELRETGMRPGCPRPVEREMCASLMVHEVADQDAAQVPFTEDENVTQTVPPDRTDETLREGIFSWAVRVRTS